jgi:hypothetical protein
MRAAQKGPPALGATLGNIAHPRAAKESHATNFVFAGLAGALGVQLAGSNPAPARDKITRLARLGMAEEYGGKAAQGRSSEVKAPWRAIIRLVPFPSHPKLL